jgi:GH24 family phage-related lysozyme (muramidase)
MNPTNECFKLIKKWEGLHRKRNDGLIEAYVDPVGIWTIGFGSIRHWDLDRPILPTDVITEVTAERWLKLEVEQVAEDVDRLIKVSLTQGMFDALVSLVYNIGIGAFGESTILRKINARDYEGAAREFDRWVHGTDNGVRKVFPGLVNRRNEEEAMFRRDGLAPTGTTVATPTNLNTGSDTKEERPYQPAPLPLPFDRTLRKGDIGDDCYILNCALAGLGLLRIAPQPNEFTEVTENAVMLFQRREALSRIEGLVGPLTGDKASLSHAGQSFERIGRTKNREP